MFDHVGIQVTDTPASAALYLSVLAPIGLIEAMRHDTPIGPAIGFADADSPHNPYFWISPGVATEPRHESHIAFAAPDRATVDAIGAAAAAAGVEILHEARLWPEYHPTYCGVFFRDLDGNNIEAVCHKPE